MTNDEQHLTDQQRDLQARVDTLRTGLATARRDLADRKANRDAASQNERQRLTRHTAERVRFYVNGGDDPGILPAIDGEGIDLVVLERDVEVATATVQTLEADLAAREDDLARAGAHLDAVRREREQRIALADVVQARANYLSMIARLRETIPNGLNLRIGEQRPVAADIATALAEADRLNDDLHTRLPVLQGREPRVA